MYCHVDTNEILINKEDYVEVQSERMVNNVFDNYNLAFIKNKCFYVSTYGRVVIECVKDKLSKKRSQFIEVVVCETISKLCNSFDDLIQVNELLHHPRVKLISLNEGIDTSTPVGRFMTSVKILQAYEALPNQKKASNDSGLPENIKAVNHNKDGLHKKLVSVLAEVCERKKMNYAF